MAQNNRIELTLNGEPMKGKLGKTRFAMIDKRETFRPTFTQAWQNMNNRELGDLFVMTTTDVAAYAEFLGLKRPAKVRQPALKPAPKAPPVMLELAPESINRLADALFDRMVERYQLKAAAAEIG